MEILYFSQLFYPSIYGGGEYFTYLVSRELVKRGHNIYVITHRLPGTEQAEVFEGMKIIRVGSELVFAGTLPPTAKHNLDYVINAFKKGKEVITRSSKTGKKIDIIHSNPFVPVLSAYLCSKFYRIPHVVSLFDIYQSNSKGFWKNWMSQEFKNAPFYAPFFARLVEKITLKLNVAAFHTISEASKQDLISSGIRDSKVTIIAPGIPWSDYQLHQEYDSIDSRIKLSEHTAVYIGRLVAYKNIDTVIKAFREVVNVLPTAKLVIIGDGPQRNKLMEEAHTIKDNVIFTGRISHTEKIQIIKKSSFMVFPSILEGFGIVLIEAFACGKPAIVSNVQPLTEIVKDSFTGLVVPAFDVKKWAAEIIGLFNEKTKLEQMGKNAYNEYLSKYEIEKTAARLEKLYERVIQKREGV